MISIKLLFVIEGLSYGGAPRRFVELANEMSLRGAEITILVHNENIMIYNIISKDIKVINKNTKPASDNWIIRNFAYRFHKIAIVRRHLNSEYYDAVISFNDMTNIDMLLLKHIKRFKLIISERSDPYYNKWYLKIIKKALFRKADGVVFQTEGAQDFFNKKVKLKSIIIFNPLPNRLYEYNNDYSKTKTKKIIVNVARMWLYQKRQDLVLKAFKKFSVEHPDYKLVLYGDGPDENKIKDIIKSLEIENKVILAGVTDDILSELLQAEIFVLSSDFEGMPNALIEAMALGMPVISTDCSPGGAKELINNYENGILVGKGDCDALYDAMLYYKKNPQKAIDMGNKAKKIKFKLDKNMIYTQWYNYCEKVIMK